MATQAELNARAAAAAKEANRTPAATPATTLGTLKNLTPMAEATRQKLVAQKLGVDIAARQVEANIERAGASAAVKFWDDRPKLPRLTGLTDSSSELQGRMDYRERTMGKAINTLSMAGARSTELSNMAEVMDIDIASKAKLADPRHIAEMARVRVAQAFEKKRLLNSFRKPSNPIMMIRGGSAIYRGGPSEEDQIDMLEEQTFRHLAKRKRLGMPLMD